MPLERLLPGMLLQLFLNVLHCEVQTAPVRTRGAIIAVQVN